MASTRARRRAGGRESRAAATQHNSINFFAVPSRHHETIRVLQIRRGAQRARGGCLRPRRELAWRHTPRVISTQPASTCWRYFLRDCLCKRVQALASAYSAACAASSQVAKAADARRCGVGGCVVRENSGVRAKGQTSNGRQGRCRDGLRVLASPPGPGLQRHACRGQACSLQGTPARWHEQTSARHQAHQRPSLPQSLPGVCARQLST